MGKDFRYYFQHPWSRMIVAYLVIFFNFLIFAEDPVSHSQTEANVIVVGNCFSFVTNKYPRGVGWRILKVLLWLLAILIGLIAGKFLFHQRLFGQLLRLKMFREDHGSWMTMFFSTILFLFIFSHIYNTILLMDGNMGAYIITDYMGIRNESFMKLAAVGTWMGDFVTAWMVTDMMLQDKPYPDWGKSARAFWKKGNIRIILFWTVLFTLTSVVVLVITTDWISWDKLNRGFLPSDEVSRAFLASFILVFDLLIVMQQFEVGVVVFLAADCSEIMHWDSSLPETSVIHSPSSQSVRTPELPRSGGSSTKPALTTYAPGPVLPTWSFLRNNPAAP
ncbi:transmembrane protein 117 isoform X2 [Nannospalax galili]|uniref:transmembrane protein 117 isoform X2 n=1 Tax=Nannospalax galili TaxID=1026970 RepID=UPI00111C693E|nr:transmembrane protein 117 isoform X2 [Nannospalax galili]